METDQPVATTPARWVQRGLAGGGALLLAGGLAIQAWLLLSSVPATREIYAEMRVSAPRLLVFLSTWRWPVFAAVLGAEAALLWFAVRRRHYGAWVLAVGVFVSAATVVFIEWYSRASAPIIVRWLSRLQ